MKLIYYRFLHRSLYSAQQRHRQPLLAEFLEREPACAEQFLHVPV